MLSNLVTKTCSVWNGFELYFEKGVLNSLGVTLLYFFFTGEDRDPP